MRGGKKSLGKPQVEQTQRIIDQRSSICSWNWASEFSARPHYCRSFLWTNLVFLSFKWKWDRDLYRSGLEVPIGARSTSALSLSVLQVNCANLIEQSWCKKCVYRLRGLAKAQGGRPEWISDRYKSTELKKALMGGANKGASHWGGGASRGNRWNSWW